MSWWRRATVLSASTLLMTFALASPSDAGDGLPKSWMGGNTAEYDMGVDRETTKEGAAAAYIRSKTATPKSFGTIVQTFSAVDFVGKRVRMSAFVKAVEIRGWAGLWMRVDGQGKDEYALSFDNMQSRPIKGTVDWERYSVVLDVPEKSKSITFGILLTGAGQAWLDDFQFEVVTTDVPVTGHAAMTLPTKPASLGFEE